MGYRGIAYKRRRKDSYEKTEQDTRRTYYKKKDVGVLKKTNSYDTELTSITAEKRGRKSNDSAIGNRKVAKKNRSKRYKKK